jgi:hypothetical protein
MDPGPLVTESIEAGARFLDEFRKYVPIQAAFWLKESDEGRWNLFVASDQINGRNFDLAYAEVGRIAEQLNDPAFDMFRVRLIRTHRPLVKAVLDLIRRHGGKRPIRLYGTILGGRSVEELYVYPSPAVAGVP